LTPDLTRMLVNLEYYPKGFFERTGNLWRAPGRRVRLELKFFRRYLTSEVLLRQDEVEGWPGEIHDGEVTEEASDSKDQGSDRGSASGPTAKSPAKKPAPTATTSSRPRPAAKKSSSSESSPSQPRPAAKKSSSGSASSSRGTTAKKSTASSRSRS
jgi:hypothetical protein